MKYYEKIEYPCGFKQEVKLETGIFGSYTISSTESDKFLREKGCPLHGKNCKRSKK